MNQGVNSLKMAEFCEPSHASNDHHQRVSVSVAACVRDLNLLICADRS
jgi:hypothetical protein